MVGNRNNPDQALRMFRDVFRDMQRHGVVCDRITYSTLITALAKRQPDEAVQVFEEMQRQNVAPDVFAYSSLINALGKSKQPERALQIFHDMKETGTAEPNLITYNTLIGVLARCNQPERALEMFEEMLQSGVTCDAITYKTLLEVFDAMKRKGSKPNVMTYNVLISLSQPDRALEVFEAMQRQGIEPNARTYSALEAALDKRGQGQQVVQDMVAKSKMSAEKTDKDDILHSALDDDKRPNWAQAQVQSELHTAVRSGATERKTALAQSAHSVISMPAAALVMLFVSSGVSLAALRTRRSFVTGEHLLGGLEEV
eukprot:gnl/TRDRNA2_/TRDRNA2_123776_c1_seq1.p1 gnl/TRDRNA2_/TRDRNA2_123776_c1~~gnl/TRDRNA2_/TRDRNA2_123776_c1_seq1.p1  ORF type:complete len:332 (+),score=46.44 gnl/TRDRNA2_/TRDRNA2_123776_c1_seq1:56-997(+)